MPGAGTLPKQFTETFKQNQSHSATGGRGSVTIEVNAPSDSIELIVQMEAIGAMATPGGTEATRAATHSEDMIRIKSYIVIAFSYRKANKLRKWSEILHFCYGNKGLCHGCRSQ